MKEFNVSKLLDRYGLGRDRKLRSGFKLIDIFFHLISKLFSCPNCMAYHLTWITTLIVLHSFIGIYIGVISFYGVKIIYDWFYTISL